MVSRIAMSLLKHIHDAFPEPRPVPWEQSGIAELREAGLIDLYDMGPRGEARWTATIEGKTALSAST